LCQLKINNHMLITEAMGIERVYVLTSGVDVVGVFATKSLAMQYVSAHRIHTYVIEDFPIVFGLPGRR